MILHMVNMVIAGAESPGVTAAAGFRAAGITAGLKVSGRPDLALVVNDGPRDNVCAVFTSNRVVGEPVKWSRVAAANGHIAAVILNSGGANVCTGPQGYADVEATAAAVAGLLGIEGADVLVASTGLIGERLPIDTLIKGVEPLVGALSDHGGHDAATAIMTTDTVAKKAHVTLETAHGTFTVGGMAKGAGMLAPALATMLVVITTDADVDPGGLRTALRAATSATFDRIDSDGCMSTSDTVALLSSGASGVLPDYVEFADAVKAVCASLARQLIADAEGASHDIAITVTNASSEEAAVAVGRAVARGNLFKAAMFGNDPNWGRVLAQMGTVPASVAPFEADEVDVTINGVMVCRGGGAHEDRSHVDLAQAREIAIDIDLHAGTARATVWTNDLTHDYVHENSAYST